ncbi:sigma-70 family RNA polymerase sigma factor [Nocardiopsis potens]|uniref:sigma-70 family RNA polymerase sigma factor n=1 Tax=Nocardiopsis potens TaxID=1246458 RepID=UPI000349DAF0|nr:sigma-70 family RNA polymerase sigma factor [Nocardiopsis potens]
MIAQPEPGSDEDRRLTGLALAARDGDPGALAELIAATRGDVERYIRRLADPQSAEELAQETYIRAMRGLPRFAGRSSVRTWLRSIARYTVVDRYRAQAARPRTRPVEEDGEAERGAPPQGSRIDEHVALADLLSGLTEERRTAFVLTRLHGYSYAEAARITGVPVGTVRSRVARAREDLARALRAADRAGRPEPR